ncbi:MAG: HDIG domain-containing protein [Thaumarchaeota archaeon]|nr:HDIG domain-containing protein [Nitrososphaerota archaeon]
MIPSETQALEILSERGANPVTIAHCKMVANVAKTLADEFKARGIHVDVEAIVAGALLHDVGRTKVQTVLHGYEGAEILVQKGVDPKVVEIVRKHVGAGITPEESRRLGLPEGDYVPRSLEEKIVCFADKIVGKDHLQPFEEEVRRFTKKGHDERRLVELKESLQRALGADPETLVLQRIKERQR